jgi:hypothetical protein
MRKGFINGGSLIPTLALSDPHPRRSPRPHRWCRSARPDLGERWCSRLVATAENHLSFRRNPHTSVLGRAVFARTIPIYEYTLSR